MEMNLSIVSVAQLLKINFCLNLSIVIPRRKIRHTKLHWKEHFPFLMQALTSLKENFEACKVNKSRIVSLRGEKSKIELFCLVGF